MDRDQQLEYEARFSRPVAIAAFGAVALYIASNVTLGAALGDLGEGDRGLLSAYDRKPGALIVGAVLEGMSVLLLTPILIYLYRATFHRRPEVPRVALVLGIVGPVLVALTSVAFQLSVLDSADEFTSSGVRTEDRAEDVLRDGSAAAVQTSTFAANAALGIALILIALQAIRAGLLSRFMGYMGVVIGALYIGSVVLRGRPTFILLFWLAALGVLFLDRWPGGRGRAWETGEAVPWPTAAEQRAAMERERSASRGEASDAAGAGDGAAIGDGTSPDDRTAPGDSTPPGERTPPGDRTAPGDGTAADEEPVSADPDTPAPAPARRSRKRRR